MLHCWTRRPRHLFVCFDYGQMGRIQWILFSFIAGPQLVIANIQEKSGISSKYSYDNDQRRNFWAPFCRTSLENSSDLLEVGRQTTYMMNHWISILNWRCRSSIQLHNLKMGKAKNLIKHVTSVCPLDRKDKMRICNLIGQRTFFAKKMSNYSVLKHVTLKHSWIKKVVKKMGIKRFIEVIISAQTSANWQVFRW